MTIWCELTKNTCGYIKGIAGSFPITLSSPTPPITINLLCLGDQPCCPARVPERALGPQQHPRPSRGPVACNTCLWRLAKAQEQPGNRRVGGDGVREALKGHTDF